MIDAYDWIDCNECDSDCPECCGLGYFMAVGNEGETECNHCDGTGDNPDDCQFCESTRRIRVPKGVGY